MRFDISLVCRLKPAGQTQTIEGVTLNLSRSGALIRIDNGRTLQAGDVLLTEVPLPTNRLFKQRCLACRGVAVRTFEEQEGCLVAVQFDHLEFRPLTEKPAPASVPLAVM